MTNIKKLAALSVVDEAYEIVVSDPEEIMRLKDEIMSAINRVKERSKEVVIDGTHY